VGDKGMSVSLCMIVKNEEDNLQRCLGSVSDIVDEIIIVDTGSTDKTVEIAQSFGAKIYHFDWDDNFSHARNYSLSKATKDWILVMDADDEFEREDKWKLLNITENKVAGANAYCGRTLCYSGEVPDKNSIIMNMNIRLVKNNRGYKFEGSIHEQIVVGPEDLNKPYALVAVDIKFHHYGYLISAIAAKDKHNRNIKLIEKELKYNPQNAFMLFNMGNEYYALRDYKKALDYYMLSYEFFDPKPGFSSMLLIRIIMSHQSMGTGKEIFKYVKLGLQYYPKFTDFEYLKGDEFLRQKKVLKSISAYKKCLKIGEPPVYMNNMAGVGTYKPHYTLSTIYTAIGEYDKAIFHCRKALKYNRAFREAYAEMVDLLKLKGNSAKVIKNKLKKNLEPSVNAYLMLSDIFYNRKHYDEACELVRDAEKINPTDQKVCYYHGVCLFNLKKYKESYECLIKVDTKEYLSRAGFIRMLCTFFDNSITNIDTTDYSKIIDPPFFKVAVTYHALVSDESCVPFSDDRETSLQYVNPIFCLLDILLKAARLDDFKKAIAMLNLILNDEVLLQLAKMYYRNGFLQPAYREFIRSIKLTGKIDAEALDMMKVLSAANIGISG
jgi:glycosyltransferase involved in cell wall biosynthesis